MIEHICSMIDGEWIIKVPRSGMLNLDQESSGKCKVCVCFDDEGRFKAYDRGRDGNLKPAMAGRTHGKDVREVCQYVYRHLNNSVLKEAMNRIGRINLEQRIMNEARLDEAPEVSLFWVDRETGKVYGDGVPIRDGMDFGDAWSGYVIHPGSHYELWKKIKQMNPAWKDVREYEDIERGRVIFAKEPNNRHFVVYMSPTLNDERYENAVIRHFGLPQNTVFDYTDEHYVIPEY